MSEKENFLAFIVNDFCVNFKYNGITERKTVLENRADG